MGRQGKATRYRHKTCSCLCLPTALPPCRQSPVKRSLLLVDDVLHFLFNRFPFLIQRQDTVID